jgi:hypothetical protein
VPRPDRWPPPAEAYTRAGALDVNAEGTLVTRNGLTVLGDGGPITVPANAQVGIAPDGTVSAVVGNGRPTAIGKLKLVTPEAPLTRGEDGLFRAADGDGRSERPRSGWCARRLERQRGRSDGGDDFRLAPVRAPDEADPDGGEAGAGGEQAAGGQRLTRQRARRLRPLALLYASSSRFSMRSLM